MSSLLIAPIEALTDARLTDPERRVLLALFSFRGKDTNTVWPALPALGKVALVNDPARVSKLTSSLAKKGWLTKRKKGFTGCNEYHLTVPPEASEEHAETIVCDSNLAPETKLAGNTSTNLVPDTKSNLVPDTKCNEQTIEHTSEHKTPHTPHPGFDDFWRAYPHKVGKRDAAKSWQRHRPDADTLIADITARLRAGSWSVAEIQFIPHPATYLNGHRWTDAIIPRRPHGIGQHPARETAVDRAIRDAREHFAEMDAHDREARGVVLGPNGADVPGEVVVGGGSISRHRRGADGNRENVVLEA